MTETIPAPFDPVLVIAKLAHNMSNATVGNTNFLVPEAMPIIYSWNDAPVEMQDSVLDGVRAILNQKVRSPEQAHENWMEHKADNGWHYGPVKDTEARQHPCMLPYSELSPYNRLKDAIFFDTVTHLIEMIGARPSLGDET